MQAVIIVVVLCLSYIARSVESVHVRCSGRNGRSDGQSELDGCLRTPTPKGDTANRSFLRRSNLGAASRDNYCYSGTSSGEISTNHGDDGGGQNQYKWVTICFRGDTITVPCNTYNWYRKQGATLGSCAIAIATQSPLSLSSFRPSVKPSSKPSMHATSLPSAAATRAPVITQKPSKQPTLKPRKTETPSKQPTRRPTRTEKPSKQPTKRPTATTKPSKQPTVRPTTFHPTKQPSNRPTTLRPTIPKTTRKPATKRPTKRPTKKITKRPTRRQSHTKSPSRRMNRKRYIEESEY